jgi:ATP-binding cassette subfamily B protein
MKPAAPSGKIFDRALLVRLVSFARPETRAFILSSALLLLMMVLSLAMPLVLGRSVDQWIQGSTDTTGMVVATVTLLGLGLGSFGARYVQTRLTHRTGQRLVHALRKTLFRHLLAQDLRFFDRHASGVLVTRVTQDIDTLNEFFTSGIDVMLADALRILGIAAVLFFLDWKLALATLAVMPLILLWAWFFQRRGRSFFRDVRERSADANGHTSEAIAGLATIRALGAESWVLQAHETRNNRLRDAHLSTVRNFSWFFPGTEFLPAVGTVLLLYVGASRVESKELEVGTLISFWFYLAMFVEPLRQLADRVNILQAAVAAGDRVFRLLDESTRLDESAVQPAPSAPSGAVRFEDVSFSYDRTAVLHALNFEVKAGERVALVGSTGAGKSTIMALICRLYDPSAGQVLIDGRSLPTLPMAWLRRHIGVVLQDVVLFAGTVRENLLLGRDAVPDEALLDALAAAQATDLVRRMGGLDGVIRERGEGLSQGERQLLAFARTLVQDPRIVILDEATASIDTETEARLVLALRRVLQGRTAVVIAHRLSTIENCDRALVLHHGRVIESGTHAQLVAANGVYARLTRLQFRPSALTD